MSKLVYPYQQVRAQIDRKIASGEWKLGETIPAEMALARELSVHRLTVNRVLTDMAREGMVRRRRGAGTVLLRLRKATYRPGSAKALVGLVTGHHFDPASNPYFGLIFDHLRRRLKGEGIYMIPLGDAQEYFGSGHEPDGPMQDIAAVAMLGIPDSTKMLRQLEQGAQRAVIIGVSEYEGPLPHVATDDEADAGLLAKRLLALGHTQIAHVNAIPPKRVQSRLHGFLRGCEAEQHALPFRYIVEAQGLEVRDGREAMREFLGRGLPFTAVFGATDHLALGAMAALADAGIRVPEEVSVVGFDGIDAARHSSPPLATMEVARGELGDRAADMLIAICKGQPLPEYRPLGSKWIAGATLAPPARQRKK